MCSNAFTHLKSLSRNGFASKVSTTCGSGWVNHPDSKSIGISHTDRLPTRYREVVLTGPSSTTDWQLCSKVERFNDWLKKNQPARVKDVQAQIAKALEGIRAEDAATDVSYAEARVAKIRPGILVTLLSATEDETMTADAPRLWIEKHKEWIATVPGAKHIVVDKTGHFIHGQQPKLVIDPIRQTLSQIR